MKMILQKHTSKFVAGLFNSLGITACVSLTSCGDKNKGKQTDNQGEKLKKCLLSKGLDEEDAKVIAEWLEKNKKDISGLNGDTLQEIFNKDTDKIKVVAEKLCLNLTNSNPESDPNPDDEKQKEIQKWLTKLNDLNNDAFSGLDKDLQEKVAQKFIENKIDITKDSVIKEKLAGFINEVVEAKKASEITLKVEGNGKVTITNVFDQKITNFDFDSFEKLQDFVAALKDKEITSKKVELSFVFNRENVKIGGHGTGFDYSTNVANFFKCFEDLIKIEGLNLNVSGLSLTFSSGQLSLSEEDFTGNNYFKTVEFWTLVKDHADLFGFTEGNKFEIEKQGEDDKAIVKVEGFETTLSWSEVVESENTLKKDSGWDKIFKIKNEEPKTEVKIEWNANNGYKLGDAEFTKIDTLEILGKLVGELNDKTVKEINGNFTLAFYETNVNICGGGNIDIKSGENFEKLLGYVKTLKDTHKVIRNDFKIKIQTSTNSIILNGQTVAAKTIKNATFWKAVKTYKDLFDGLRIIVVRDKTLNSNKGKIGKTVIDVDIFQGVDIAAAWNDVFQK